MTRTDDHRRIAEYLAVAELLTPHLSGPTAHRLADVTQVSGIAGVLEGDAEPPDDEWTRGALRRRSPDRVDYWLNEVSRLGELGVHVVTIDDPEYPANLLMIHNRPPVLFARGAITESDNRAMAVVGTRDATDAGLAQASKLAGELAARHVTVVSGLARGIDTAAHAAALNAGGRTIAVFGTGITRVHPRGNEPLARSIDRAGACVTQFWPDQSGARWTFPMRNVVTSGLSLGTVVVEAGESSGARLQANNALDHGKRLFLLRELVTKQPWAQAMAARPEVHVVDEVDEILEAVDTDLCVERELTVEFTG